MKEFDRNQRRRRIPSQAPPERWHEAFLSSVSLKPTQHPPPLSVWVTELTGRTDAALYLWSVRDEWRAKKLGGEPEVSLHLNSAKAQYTHPAPAPLTTPTSATCITELQNYINAVVRFCFGTRGLDSSALGGGASSCQSHLWPDVSTHPLRTQLGDEHQLCLKPPHHIYFDRELLLADCSYYTAR